METEPLSDKRRAAAAKSHASRWGGRGESATIRVDRDAAASLARIPERDRRRVASDAIRAAVAAYAAANW